MQISLFTAENIATMPQAEPTQEPVNESKIIDQDLLESEDQDYFRAITVMKLNRRIISVNTVLKHGIATTWQTFGLWDSADHKPKKTLKTVKLSDVLVKKSTANNCVKVHLKQLQNL